MISKEMWGVRSIRRLTMVAVVCLLGVLSASPGWAQSKGSLDEARELALSGFKRLEIFDYEGALADCRGALEIIDAPAVQVCAASALMGLERYRDAAEVYEKVASFPVAAGEDPAVSDARAEAKRGLAVAKTRVGMSQLDTQDYQGALETCEEAVAMADVPGAKVCAAQALMGLGRPAEALVLAREVAQRSVGSGDEALADAHSSAQRMLPEVEQEAARFHADEGIRLAEDGKAQEALVACEASLAATKTVLGDYCRAVALKGLGRFVEALPVYAALVDAEASGDPAVERALAAARETAPRIEVEAARQLARQGLEDPEGEASAGCERSLELRASALGLLCRAVAFDASGQRSRALAAYEDVLGFERDDEVTEDVSGIRERAEERAEELQAEEAERARLAAEERERAATRSRRMKITSYAMMGVGGAGLAGAGVFYMLANQTHGELTEVCSTDLVCGGPQQDRIDALSAQRLGIYIGAGVGIAALTGAGVMMLMSGDEGAADVNAQASASGVRWQMGLMGLQGLVLRGEF